ncbi:hypothetical protein MANES_07G038733v8 [Manihot esculenta]|uniref:Uncharacterized protein n=1 Tax=Manihot esculenta TaxID=3983 RepID=A0ACB7HFD1_MANES|nr:hypothetical protein MANES_07G038733v8 [Manihot esculenta]
MTHHYFLLVTHKTEGCIYYMLMLQLDGLIIKHAKLVNNLPQPPITWFCFHAPLPCGSSMKWIVWPCKYITKSILSLIPIKRKAFNNFPLEYKGLFLYFPPNFQFLKKINKMISSNKLLKLARKWQKMAAIRRRRITSSQNVGSTDTASVAEKGHFVVYSTDKKRFLLPLEYLNNEIIKELLNMAEEEFGLQSEGPLTLPCDADLMEYAVALLRRRATKDVERALLVFIASNCCSSSLPFQHQATRHQLPICSC